MRKTFYWTFLLFIPFLTGCIALFSFRQPRPKEFSFYDRKASTSLIKTEGYYFTFQSDVSRRQNENYKFVIDTMRTLHLLKFGPGGNAIYVKYGCKEPLSCMDYAKQDINKKFADTIRLNRNGYYYIANDTIHLEILNGDGAHGYYFFHYTGQITEDSIILKRTATKRYRRAMKERIGTDSELIVKSIE